MLTCGSCPTAYVVIFVIKLDSHPFAVASRHSTAAAPAQWDRDNSVDVSQHDGDADAYTTQCKHTLNTVEVLSFKVKLYVYSIFLFKHFLDSSKQKDKNGMWQMFLGQFPKTDDAFLQRFKLWATKETLLNNSNVGEEQMVKERKWKEREKNPQNLLSYQQLLLRPQVTQSRIGSHHQLLPSSSCA